MSEGMGVDNWGEAFALREENAELKDEMAFLRTLHIDDIRDLDREINGLEKENALLREVARCADGYTDGAVDLLELIAALAALKDK